jgi:hypothetical protein
LRILLHDSWFGNKGNIRTALELELVAIFMMRRGNLLYRFQGRNYTAKTLYELVKRRMATRRGCRFLTFSLTVEINLAEKNEAAHWVPVRLLLSKPRRENVGSWVVLLCTDTGYSDERFDRTDEKLEDIHTHDVKTNGCVTKLERWSPVFIIGAGLSKNPASCCGSLITKNS